jgi:hypothetical protein
MNAPLTDSCCVVTKMDTVATDSVVTVVAKNKLTNEDIRFHVPLTFAVNVHEGNTVFTNPSHGYAMLLTNTDSTSKALFGFPLLEDTTGKENQLRTIITTPNTKKTAAE